MHACSGMEDSVLNVSDIGTLLLLFFESSSIGFRALGSALREGSTRLMIRIYAIETVRTLVEGVEKGSFCIEN